MFFGTGAYTVGIAAQDWHVTGDPEFALLPLAGLAAGLVAVPFGLIALRVRRHTFVVVTIAIFFIFQLMAYNFRFTGGIGGHPRAVPDLGAGDLQQSLLLPGLRPRGRGRARPG